jgi:hypothetical protein
VNELDLFGGYCDMCLSATAQSFMESYVSSNEEQLPLTIYLHMGLIYGVKAILSNLEIADPEQLLDHQSISSLPHFLRLEKDENGVGLDWTDFTEQVVTLQPEQARREVRYRLIHKSSGREIIVVMVIREQ